jgi:hypothetical protein
VLLEKTIIVPVMFKCPWLITNDGWEITVEFIKLKNEYGVCVKSEDKVVNPAPSTLNSPAFWIETLNTTSFNDVDLHERVP